MISSRCIGSALTLALLLGRFSCVGSEQQRVEVRLATILPANVGQDFLLKKLEQDWSKSTGGRVFLKRAPGMAQEGEGEIVRKLEAGALDAGLVSMFGASAIEPEAAVLQNLPLFYQDWDEVDYVREKLRDRLEGRLRDKGFVTLFWADAGWVNFFSVTRAVTPAEFKPMKLFVWAGNEKQAGLMRALGYDPVAMEIEDLYTGFVTEKINAAPIAPTFALGILIPTVAPKVLDVNWAPIVGIAVVRAQKWDAIPAEFKVRLLALCQKAGADIRTEGRRFHRNAMETLRKGPRTQVYTPSPEELQLWQTFGRELMPRIRGELVPAEVFDQAVGLLNEYRAAHPSQPAQAAQPRR